MKTLAFPRNDQRLKGMTTDMKAFSRFSISTVSQDFEDEDEDDGRGGFSELPLKKYAPFGSGLG